MNDTLYTAATLVLPMIFAIVFHEVSHGYAARALGDGTAQERGRLSLNPLRHIDPFGTIILPGILKLSGLPVFGWAKPVPVNYGRLRTPKRDMALVAAAGPASNIVLALLTAVALGLLVRSVDYQSGAPGLGIQFLAENLQNFLVVNLFLALFNLLPLPPFDGSRILRGVLPRGGVRLLDRIEPIGIPLFFAVFVILPWLVPGLHIVDRIILPPVGWLLDHFVALASWIAGADPA
ncbi:site-2 protease family protein [Novosphingobium cyanobacteriorum]|uniref:Site-2 protease family protein n=1 Tax=Novosphingobium cyanobacteriorum TaxID=3024215 RepID=A0ABT6CP69_9SPHN|nr:site-2 protease family protein [Novosphingobium cyanobacteriorum]MDF8335028.1 site-2 protease family protein [Novosphingobium cyanobacteriorum]